MKEGRKSITFWEQTDSCVMACGAWMLGPSKPATKIILEIFEVLAQQTSCTFNDT